MILTVGGWCAFYGRRSIFMGKRKSTRDNRREHRIEMEIVVDAHDADERDMGWYH